MVREELEDKEIKMYTFAHQSRKITKKLTLKIKRK
jgi:hypothetical protein